MNGWSVKSSGEDTRITTAAMRPMSTATVVRRLNNDFTAIGFLSTGSIDAAQSV